MFNPTVEVVSPKEAKEEIERHLLTAKAKTNNSSI